MRTCTNCGYPLNTQEVDCIRCGAAAHVMSDGEILNWIEKVHAQVWYDRHSDNWVCQVIRHPLVIQPSRKTLRAAISDARQSFETSKLS